jgi:hypothetical protein
MTSPNPHSDAVSEEADPKLVAILTDLDAACDALPQEEKEEYERCQQSIVDARRAAEREGWHIWIG